MMERRTIEKLSCGCQIWTNDQGRQHRLDGPAIDRSDCKWGHKQAYGTEAYCLNGVYLTKEEHHRQAQAFEEEMKKSIERMILNCYCWAIVMKNKVAVAEADMISTRARCCGIEQPFVQ